MSALHRYLGRLHDTILSRREIRIEEIEITDRSDVPGQLSEFYARLRFPDHSQLQVVEKLIVKRYSLVKDRYAYHFQRADGVLVFRYDNVPHHPEVKSFPHHKHVGDTVIASVPPDLSEVLREIDGILYA
ncbi:toxin-antitoxin system TumE family protein [Candidatus Amarolinea aalborgensis]|jgi:hypothetical protein|uniref:toxin-antitoxin system TumE family protein n=1 Tax=Candidatus Amarolinea aalborgensis TaxID=2249329 RepID=UPI003BF9E8F4